MMYYIERRWVVAALLAILSAALFGATPGRAAYLTNVVTSTSQVADSAINNVELRLMQSLSQGCTAHGNQHISLGYKIACVAIYAVACLAVLALLCLTVLALVVCYVKCYRRSKSKVSYERQPQDEKRIQDEKLPRDGLVQVVCVEDVKGKEDRDKARMKQEKTERGKADVSKKMFKKKYSKCSKLPDLGSRLQKYWFLRGESKKEWTAMQFTAKTSKKCQFAPTDSSTLESLNNLFSDLQHPYLLPTYGVTATEEYVSVVQKFMPGGSLRDKLYQAQPTKDWSEKYKLDAGMTTMGAKEVATCSRHILEAVLALYEAGFPVIGQIHSGNIFCSEEKYMLGGYENTVLGYRTSQYADMKKEGMLDSIDVVMLGHLVYEISSGCYLPEVCPSKSFKFEKVEDSQVRNFVTFIFSVNAKKSYKKAVKQILSHRFLKHVAVIQAPPIEVTPQSKELLDAIRDPNHSEVPQGRMSKSADVVWLTEDYGEEYGPRRHLERIGWRQEKDWAQSSHGSWGEVLVSASPVPNTCPVYVRTNVKFMKEVLEAAQLHPYIHSVLEIQYMKTGGRHFTIFTEFLRKGSVKDFLYNKSNPTNKWDIKYAKSPQTFESKQIAKYGAQILDALIFLYSMGFPHTGQVTSGNVYVHGDKCLLGGLDNVLLGHRTESYTTLRNTAGEFIDVLMFGLVLLEMATGKSLKKLPLKQDYKKVSGDLRSALDYIFEIKNSIHNVRQHTFFKDIDMESLETPKLSKNAKVLLQKVKKGKWRNQDNHTGKIKEAIKAQTFRKYHEYQS